MAETSATMAGSYPLPVYNFAVTIDGTQMAVTEVSGLDIERRSVTYRHGLSDFEGELFHSFADTSFKPITLSRGVFQGSKAFFDWINATPSEARTMQVSLLDAVGAPAVTWTVRKVYPVKLSGPAFSPDDNAVALETLELMGSGIELEHQ